MGRLYDIHIKPKMETMKTEIKNMEIHIDAQRREIESLKNRVSIFAWVGFIVSVLSFLRIKIADFFLQVKLWNVSRFYNVIFPPSLLINIDTIYTNTFCDYMKSLFSLKYSKGNKAIISKMEFFIFQKLKLKACVIPVWFLDLTTNNILNFP